MFACQDGRQEGEKALAIAWCVFAEYSVQVCSIWVWRWFN